MVKFCTLYSGSSGNSLLVSGSGTTILIDAGVSAKKIDYALKSAGQETGSVSAALLTHDHYDHICGIDVLSRKFSLPVFGNAKTLFAAGLGEGPLKRTFITGESFHVGEISVTAFPLPHDAPDPVGFRLYFPREDKTVAIATDLGYVSPGLFENLMGADLIYIESNHDVDMLKNGSYPAYLKRRILGKLGHLSNDDCAALSVKLVKKGTAHLILGHLSRHNNMPEMAFNVTARVMADSGIAPNKDVELKVAPAFEIGPMISI